MYFHDHFSNFLLQLFLKWTLDPWWTRPQKQLTLNQTVYCWTTAAANIKIFLFNSQIYIRTGYNYCVWPLTLDSQHLQLVFYSSRVHRGTSVDGEGLQSCDGPAQDQGVDVVSSWGGDGNQELEQTEGRSHI